MVRTVDAGDHEALARNRSTTFARLRRELGGDLENIVQKALKKRPEDRYLDRRGVRRRHSALPGRRAGARASGFVLVSTAENSRAAIGWRSAPPWRS